MRLSANKAVIQDEAVLMHKVGDAIGLRVPNALYLLLMFVEIGRAHV